MNDHSPSGPAAPTLDAALARQWLGILHGDTVALGGLVHVCSTGDWTGRTFANLDSATNYVRHLDAEGRQGIYVRVTTLRGALAPGRRGGAADTAALPALWADLDLAGPGHAEQDLPPDENAGRAIIAATGLPEPTLWIHSGGGLYPIWLLGKPWLITDENRDQAARLAKDWQRVIEHAAAAKGWRYGRGVGDLARVLRIPGTINGKAGLARPCLILPGGLTGTRYGVEQLAKELDAAVARIAPPAPPPAPVDPAGVVLIGAPAPPNPRNVAEVTPGDDFNARAEWPQILGAADWREHYRNDDITYWTRPGKPTGISASTNALGTDRLYVFTTSAPPLEGGESYSKFGAYTLLRFGALDAEAFKKATSELAKEGYGVRRDLAAENRAALAELLGGSTELAPSTRVFPTGPVDNPPAAEPATATPPAAPVATIAAAGGGAYFTDTGAFLAATLAADILKTGPLAVGADDIMWCYRGGVWTAARHAVRERAVRLLGERYRNRHSSDVESIVRASVERISCEPVPELINFRNGLLDWRSGRLRAHSPDVPTTVQLPHDWTPGAPCPRFDAFLAEIVPADMVATVWELIGYLMYSGNPLHKAVMLMGKGRNGKGTLLRVIVALLGKRNTTAVSLHDLISNRFAKATLFGKTANIAGDIDSTYLESTAAFKAITGQDQISAEHKNRDFFDFTPWAVPVFSANEIPPSADTTTGYLSRWLTIPFPADFTGREERALNAKLHTEIPGIAAKAIPALRQLMDRGNFEITESGQAAYDDFVRRVDQVRAWIGDCCDIAPGPHEANAHPFLLRTELYRAYRDWCARDGHKAIAASKFYDRLGAAGATPIKLAGARGFRGLRIVDRPVAMSEGGRDLLPAPP